MSVAFGGASGGTTAATFFCDGVENRVACQETTRGVTTTTYVAGGQEEAITTGSTTTLTKYYAGPNGLPTAERVGTNGPLYVLASDRQGTVSESFDTSGTVTSAQRFTPYGVSAIAAAVHP